MFQEDLQRQVAAARWRTLGFWITLVVDWLLTRIGNNIREFYSNIQVLKSQSVLSFVCLIFCCSSTLSESWYMIVVVVIVLLLNLAIYRCGNRLRVFLEQMKTLYTALPFLGNCGGIIAILFGFVYLAEALDEHQGIDVFAVGFFYCLFINFSTLAKVLGAKDFWGIADNTMALSILLLITFKGVLKKTFARNLVLVGVIEVVFEMFKMAPITVKNVTNAVPVLPVQEAGNVVPIPPTSQQVVCKYWTLGICNKGVGCQFLHSYSTVPGLGLSKILLRMHKKEIRGIAFLPGSEVLYSASCDGLMQTWRQGSYDLLETKRLRDEVGSLVSGDLWIFVGMRNDIKIFNIENECQYILCVDGLVSAMLFGNDMIIAGASNGRIVFWRILHGVMNVGNPFGKTISFRDTHMDEVTSLVIGGDQNLYSGSLDGSIMVWNFNSLARIQTRVIHSDSVTSLVWGNQRVFSSSLDGTVIGSRFIGNNSWEIVDNIRIGTGVHSLFRSFDQNNVEILLCSSGTGSVSVYDLLSLRRRGKLFSKAAVVAFATHPNGGIITGDRDGNIHMWSFTT